MNNKLDPKEALERADRAVKGLELAVAAEALDAYWQWRGGGGAEPEIAGVRGDAFAQAIEQRLADARG